MNLARYKYVVQVVIGEQRGEGVRMGSRCFWDSETDNVASETYINVRDCPLFGGADFETAAVVARGCGSKALTCTCVAINQHYCIFRGAGVATRLVLRQEYIALVCLMRQYF